MRTEAEIRARMEDCTDHDLYQVGFYMALEWVLVDLEAEE